MAYLSSLAAASRDVQKEGMGSVARFCAMFPKTIDEAITCLLNIMNVDSLDYMVGACIIIP